VLIFLDVAIPAITFLLLTAVGLDLTSADFDRVRRRPRIVAIGLGGPLVVLPPLALLLIGVVRPSPAVAAGLLLIAACPVGGVSNTYSYLAGASTALSVTLTGLSCLGAVVTIPLLTVIFEQVLEQPLGFAVPTGTLITQLLLVLALPIGLGMYVRHRWPAAAEAHRPAVQRLGFGALGLLIIIVTISQADQFRDQLADTVPLALAFVGASMAVGWSAGRLVGADRPDRFTLAIEFSTRNVAIATAIAVVLLGQVRFAVFATTYFLIEAPVMLAAIGIYRRGHRISAVPSREG
jgi:BASS family bile acid:Na+ symporter